MPSTAGTELPHAVSGCTVDMSFTSWRHVRLVLGAWSGSSMGWTSSVYGVSGLGEATVHQHCLVQQELSGKSRDGGLWNEQGRKWQAQPHGACVLGWSQSVTGTWAGAGLLLVAEGLAALIVGHMHSSLTHDTMNALSLQKRPESEILASQEFHRGSITCCVCRMSAVFDDRGGVFLALCQPPATFPTLASHPPPCCRVLLPGPSHSRPPLSSLQHTSQNGELTFIPALSLPSPHSTDPRPI